MKSSPRRRVVVTGLGAVTPLGNNVRETWQGLCDGKSGIGKITIFNAESFPTKIAGEVKGFNFSKWTRTNGTGLFLGRNSHFALEAAGEAVHDAGIDIRRLVPERFGVYFGAGDGGFDFSEYA
ncbi:MAG: beta-ketoacyl-[acyl-carrier-protein] synthase II, partial [Candidatus Omnitrophica bacterium]|nr:beta-ketoacyl-[acyl-carrier-protein] synthase II [Candidatus Omnitrophota bacterium]